MKTKVSPAMIGIFVLGAFGLGLIALLSFGGISFFSKPQRFTVYFNESIHGLDLGSSVKMRGVRVGRVVDLSVRYDAARRKSDVAVICELSRNMITDPVGRMVDVSDREVLQGLIDRGLRAQLGVVGLATGLLFVELDFYNPAEYPAGPPAADQKYILIPAVPSAISEYQASLSEILSDLKRVDFAELSKDMKGLIADTRKQINKIEVKELIVEWTKAAQAVQALATSPELKIAITHFDEAASQMKVVLAKVEAQVEPTGTKLGETMAETKKALESVNATAATLRRFINAQQHVGDDASQALQRLAEAADAVQRLADFLERNPSAIVSGRKQPK
ncbi:MAG: MlaD family protein [Opitutaceae bacterium]|jgi:paraquat-inducible protein B